MYDALCSSCSAICTMLKVPKSAAIISVICTAYRVLYNIPNHQQFDCKTRQDSFKAERVYSFLSR